jgi:non-canonical (house-cleaning) NTP pyrophosphatase
MDTIRIAVGSKRAPKLKAVREALKALGPLLHPKSSFEVRGFEVATGVSHTPRSRTELMAGARGRCEALMRPEKERHPGARHHLDAVAPSRKSSYFVGLEGGLDVVYENGRENGRRLVFLESWAFVSDANGKGFYGQSGAILLPEALAAEVLDRGMELSRAIEAYTGTHGIRDSQGAWGVLTKNLINRQESFRIAVISAFAPFFNADIYRRR